MKKNQFQQSPKLQNLGTPLSLQDAAHHTYQVMQFCNYSHKRGDFPAINKHCNSCGRRGHQQKGALDTATTQDPFSDSDDNKEYFVGTAHQDQKVPANPPHGSSHPLRQHPYCRWMGPSHWEEWFNHPVQHWYKCPGEHPLQNPLQNWLPAPQPKIHTPQISFRTNSILWWGLIWVYVNVWLGLLMFKLWMEEVYYIFRHDA